MTKALGHYDNCLDYDHGLYEPMADHDFISYADYFVLDLGYGAQEEIQIYGSFRFA